MVESSAKKLHCQVVTPERQVIDKKIDFIVLTATDGQIGILPDHAPLLCKLIPSALKIVENGNEDYLYVSDGFAEVLNNTVTIISQEALTIDEINPSELEDEIKRLSEQSDKIVALDENARKRALELAEAKRRVYYTIKEKIKNSK